MVDKELQALLTKHRMWSYNNVVENDIDFGNSHFSSANFRGLDLRGADLRCIDLTGADLSHTNLTGAMFSGVLFQLSDFYQRYIACPYSKKLEVKVIDFTKIKYYNVTNVWLKVNESYGLIPIKEITVWQKMIANKDKSTAVLYKNTWMADFCKEILKNS